MFSGKKKSGVLKAGLADSLFVAHSSIHCPLFLSIRSVPSHWLPDFAAESQEAAKHVKNLKNKVAKHRAVSSYL